MAVTSVTKQVAEAFEKLGASFRFSHAGGTGVISCDVIDKMTKRVYATAIGDSEENAAANALIAAQGAEKPMTPAQLAHENTKLRQRIAELEATKPEAGATAPADPADESVAEPEPLSAAEIVAALKHRDIAVPDGDRRTKEWRTVAMQAIEDFEKTKEPASVS